MLGLHHGRVARARRRALRLGAGTLLLVLIACLAPASTGRATGDEPAHVDDAAVEELTRCLQDLFDLVTATDRAPAGVDESGGGGSLSAERPPWDAGMERPSRVAVTHLSPEMIETCLLVADDIDKRLGTQLRELRRRQPEAFEVRLRQTRRLIAMAELRRRDRSLYDLKLLELETDAEVSRLAAEVRLARRERRAADVRALEQELQGKVILQIALRHRAKEDYLCRLRELLERLEHEQRHEREHFAEVLERRMHDLLADVPPT